MALFCQGLNPVLHEHLTLFGACSLNELVSASIQQENTCGSRMEEEKMKRPMSGPIRGTPPKYYLVPLHRSSGATIHLSRWHHALQSTYSCLLHLELFRQPVLQLWVDWALRLRVHPTLTGLLI
jgi:hypothetical protein